MFDKEFMSTKNQQAEFNRQQDEAIKAIRETPLLKPHFFDYGMGFQHNMPCAIYHEEIAVLDTSTGAMQPSWKAQEDGWRTVKFDPGDVVVVAKSRFAKLLVRLFLKEAPSGRRRR